MPSFTFVSTANAFVLRGATPGLRRHPRGHAQPRRDARRGGDHAADAGDRARRTTPASAARWTRSSRSPTRTGCVVIEDAAQGILATLPRAAARRASATSARSASTRRRTCTCGEGGALLVNDASAASSAPRSSARRAPTAARSSAARSTSTRGSTSARRTCPSEINAAFLWAQLEQADEITARAAARSGDATTTAFEPLEAAGACAAGRARRTARTTRTCTTCCCPTARRATRFIDGLDARGVHAVFHYVPLHTSAAGRRFGRATGRARRIRSEVSERLVRLPLWVGYEGTGGAGPGRRGRRCTMRSRTSPSSCKAGAPGLGVTVLQPRRLRRRAGLQQRGRSAARRAVGRSSRRAEDEIVLVNDGSTDASWDEIDELAAPYPRVRGIDLMRNYGQHNALLAGIRAARGDDRSSRSTTTCRTRRRRSRSCSPSSTRASTSSTARPSAQHGLCANSRRG